MSDRLTIGQVLQNEPMSLIKPLTAECVLAHGLIRGVYIYIYIYIYNIYIHIYTSKYLSEDGKVCTVCL